MAQINVVVNTEDNTLSVTINGSMIPNITDCTTYRETDSDGNVVAFYVRITAKELLENSLVKLIEYYSYGSPQAQAAIASGEAIYNDDLPDFVGVATKSKVQQDIASFLQRK